MLISGAGGRFSLGRGPEAQRLGGPEGGQHSWQVDTLTRWQGEETALQEDAEGDRKLAGADTFGCQVTGTGDGSSGSGSSAIGSWHPGSGG